MNASDCPVYPTPDHEAAAVYATEFFSRQKSVDSVWLTCSCARGSAEPASCVDIAAVVPPGTSRAARQQLGAAWAEHSQGSPVLAALARHGRYAGVHMEVIDGQLLEHRHHHDVCSGPDEFELEIGNFVQYSVPLHERVPRLAELRREWLPYYSEELRERRLAMVNRYCLNNIDHVKPYVDRQLYFQAFRRLYNAAGEFLQALFIARRTYPVAYDKWIKEQFEEILELPELYPRFVELHSISNFESAELTHKAEALREMFTEYCAQDGPTG